MDDSQHRISWDRARRSGKSMTFARSSNPTRRRPVMTRKIVTQRYDWQRIKTNRPYTLEGLAALYSLHPATVRRWIKHGGLSVAVIDQTRPMLLSGAETRLWMKAQQDNRRQECGPSEMYCVGCKSPQTVAPETVQIIAQKPPKITLTGDCGGCGRTLRRFDTEANRNALTDSFGLKPPDSQGTRAAPNSVSPSPLKHSLPIGE